MVQAQKGDNVKVHYTGRLDDGTVFDSSEGRDPLEFTLGSEDVIPGFDAAVTGMEPGQTRTAQIPAKEAYGDYDENLVTVVDRAQFPPEIQPEIGQELQLRTSDGQSVVVTIADLDDEEITLDGNHPLAGEDLTFEIALVEITSPTA